MKYTPSARPSASARRKAQRSQPQSSCRRISLTAQAFPHATCAGCAFFCKTYENDQTLLRLAMKIGWTLNVVIMEAELTKAQRLSCLQRAASKKLSKKKLLEIILNGVFAEESIDAPDEICYNIIDASVGRTEQAQFEPPLRRVTERKRGFARYARRKISSLVSYCCSLVSDFLSVVYCFPYLQAWLGSA